VAGVVADDAEQVSAHAFALGVLARRPRCDCGLVSRGVVAADDEAPGHYCRACSAAHCQQRAHALGLL
jgi:hypothetical protein